ncbi:HNH endonuclease-domain-containing protein [Lipomyces kononenkoae]
MSIFLDILIASTGAYRVTLRRTGEDIMSTDNTIRPGQYDLRPYSPSGKLSMSFCAGSVLMLTQTLYQSPTSSVFRTLSRNITDRNDFFRAQVRVRDGKCVITGTVNEAADIDEWIGFEAAHIFPVSHEDYFVRSGFSTWITNRTGRRDTGINSVQNGLLMQSNIHQQFDTFDIAVNPDDGYKITCFGRDSFKVVGRTIDPICREGNGEEGARDQLLRWHFRQAVLANMKGGGEPSFEMDFPPGTDMVGEILNGPKAAERMEAELFLRLRGIGVPYDDKLEEPSWDEVLRLFSSGRLLSKMNVIGENSISTPRASMLEHS